MEIMAGEVGIEMERIVEESFHLQRSPGGTPWLGRYPGQSNDSGRKINYAGLARDFANKATPSANRLTDRPAGIDTGALSKSFKATIKGNKKTTSPREVYVESPLSYAETFHKGGPFSINLGGLKRRANDWLRANPFGLTGMEKGKVMKALGLGKMGGKTFGNKDKTKYEAVMVRRPLVDFPTSTLRSLKHMARRRLDAGEHVQLAKSHSVELRGAETTAEGRGIGGTQFATDPGLGVGEVSYKDMAAEVRARAVARMRTRGQWLQRNLEGPTAINHEFFGRG